MSLHVLFCVCLVFGEPTPDNIGRYEKRQYCSTERRESTPDSTEYKKHEGTRVYYAVLRSNIYLYFYYESAVRCTPNNNLLSTHQEQGAIQLRSDAAMARITYSNLALWSLALLSSWNWQGLNFVSYPYASVPTVALSSPVPDSTENIEIDGNEWVSLDDLTDAELENICTSRGFELLRDEEIGESSKIIYTHQYYVEAAQQCLAIGEEIEKVLQENPDMLQQLVEEVARLEQRKAELEEALDQMENYTALDLESLAFIKTFKLQTTNKTEGRSKSVTSALVPINQESTLSSVITVFREPIGIVRKQIAAVITVLIRMSFAAAKLLHRYVGTSMSFRGYLQETDVANQDIKREAEISPTCDISNEDVAE